MTQEPTEDHNRRIIIVGNPFAGLGQMIGEAIAMSAIHQEPVVLSNHRGFSADSVFFLDECREITEHEWRATFDRIPVTDAHLFSLAADQAKLRAQQLTEALKSIQFDLDRARRLPGLAAPPKLRRRNRGRNKALDRIFCKEAYCQRRD